MKLLLFKLKMLGPGSSVVENLSRNPEFKGSIKPTVTGKGNDFKLNLKLLSYFLINKLNNKKYSNWKAQAFKTLSTEAIIIKLFCRNHSTYSCLNYDGFITLSINVISLYVVVYTTVGVFNYDFDWGYANGTESLKNVKNCLNTNTFIETSGGQSSNLYLNVVHFFNTSVSWTSVAA
jgi:hypothetical protein